MEPNTQVNGVNVSGFRIKWKDFDEKVGPQLHKNRQDHMFFSTNSGEYYVVAKKGLNIDGAKEIWSLRHNGVELVKNNQGNLPILHSLGARNYVDTAKEGAKEALKPAIGLAIMGAGILGTGFKPLGPAMATMGSIPVIGRTVIGRTLGLVTSQGAFVIVGAIAGFLAPLLGAALYGGLKRSGEGLLRKYEVH